MASNQISLLIYGGLNGECLAEINVASCVRLNAVKKHISTKLKIPPVCQQLVFHNTVLQEDNEGSCAAFEELCTDVCPKSRADIKCGKPSLHISLVVVVDLLLQQMKSPDGWERAEALEALVLVPLSDESRIDVAIDCLKSETESMVKTAAVHALACIAPRGESSVVNALAACVGDITVEAAAFDALAGVAKKGDSTVISILILRLSSSSVEETKVKIMKTLERVVVRGDDSVTEAVLPLASDSRAPIRGQALLTLAKVAPIGHKGSIQLCANLLTNSYEWHAGAKYAAVRVLMTLMQKPDHHVSSCLCVLIEETALPWLRVGALHLLAQAIPVGHKYAEEVLKEHAYEL